jgi:hypothetical protein
MTQELQIASNELGELIGDKSNERFDEAVRRNKLAKDGLIWPRALIGASWLKLE